jgi:hypothetical protein
MVKDERKGKPMTQNGPSHVRQLTYLLALAVMVAALALVVACGRKGNPEPPPGSDFPRSYPSR